MRWRSVAKRIRFVGAAVEPRGARDDDGAAWVVRAIAAAALTGGVLTLRSTR